MSGRKFRYPLAIMLCSAVLSLGQTGGNLWASSFPLDGEAVFCLYHKLSGTAMDDQDMEEFNFKSGRPSFTLFKPSEMFMKHDLSRLRARLAEKVRNYDEGSLFRLSFKCTVTAGTPGNGGGGKLLLDSIDMPQPTQYISSELSDVGRRSVRQVLNSMVNDRVVFKNEKEMEIILCLKPEGVDYRYEKRNVALEDMVLPLRCVIFQPVSLEVNDKKTNIETFSFE